MFEKEDTRGGWRPYQTVFFSKTRPPFWWPLLSSVWFFNESLYHTVVKMPIKGHFKPRSKPFYVNTKVVKRPYIGTSLYRAYYEFLSWFHDKYLRKYLLEYFQIDGKFLGLIVYFPYNLYILFERLSFKKLKNYEFFNKIIWLFEIWMFCIFFVSFLTFHLCFTKFVIFYEISLFESPSYQNDAFKPLCFAI